VKIGKLFVLVLALCMVFTFTNTALAATSTTMNYDNTNNFYYGTGSSANYNFHLEHWPGYNQSLGTENTTYIEFTYNYYGTGTMAYDTFADTNVLYPESLQFISNSPPQSDVTDNWQWHGSEVDRTVIMNVGSYQTVGIYAPYTWEQSSYSYNWNDYGTWVGVSNTWAATGLYTSNGFAPLVNFSSIYLSNWY